MPDRYGDPLPEGALARMGTIVGSGARIYDLALSGDGAELAVAAGSEIRVLEATTGRLLRVLSGHFANAACVAFAPDGKRIFSGSADGTLRIWKGERQKAKVQIGEHRNEARVLQVHGDTLVLAAYQSLFVYDLEGRCRQTVEGFGSWINDLSLHPDGTGALVCCDQNLWRVSLTEPWGHKKSTAELEQIGAEGWARAATYLPDGKLAVVQAEHSIEVREVATWKLMRELPGETRRAQCIVLSDDGQLIAAGVDGHVHVWRTRDSEQLVDLEVERNDVNAICFTAGDSQMLTGGCDGLLRRWSTETFEQLDQRPRHNSYVAAVGFSPDGSQVVSCGENRDVRLWSASGEHLGCEQGQTFSVACSLTEPICVIGHRDYHAALYRIGDAGFEPLRDLDGEGPVAWFRAFAFSSDGTAVAAASDGAVMLWDVATGELRWKKNTQGTRMWAVTFSPSGALVAASGEDRQVRVWNTQDGKHRETLELLAEAQFVGFLDEEHLLVSSETVRLWRLGDDVEVRRYPTEGRVYALSNNRRAFVCDGGGESFEVRACADNRVLHRFEGHGITSAAFSTDDRLLVTGSHDRTAVLWQLELPKSLPSVVQPTAAPKPHFELVLTTHPPDALPFWDVNMSQSSNACTPEQDFPTKSGVWINLPQSVSLAREGVSSPRRGTPPKPVVPLCGYQWNEGSDNVTGGLFIVARDLATGKRASGHLRTSIDFGHSLPPPPVDPDERPAEHTGGSGGPFNVSMGFLVSLAEKPATYELTLEHANGDRSNTVTLKVVP